jgi:hypothetical protein
MDDAHTDKQPDNYSRYSRFSGAAQIGVLLPIRQCDEQKNDETVKPKRTRA